MAKKGRASRAAVWVILGLLFIGLLGFGIGDFGGSIRTVGTVNDREIELQTFGNELQTELRNLSSQTGRQLSIAEARTFGIDSQVLSRMVGEALLDSEADRLGLSVGDETVRDQIQASGAAQGLDGSFDREVYAANLRNSGRTIAQFEAQIRDETARNILQGAIIGSIETPKTYVDTLYNFIRERRDITWARLDETQLTDEIPEPSEEDLVAFHAEHPEPFTLGETRAITYAWLTPEMLVDTIAYDDTLLREFYDNRIHEFVQPERRLVERLVFRDDAAALEAKEQIESGETSFEEMVEGRGLSLADVDVGAVTVEELDNAGEGVFALGGPGIAGPLPSSLGPALYRVNAILAANETSFEDARDDLEADYAQVRAGRLIDEMREDLDDLLAGGATIEELADETEMEVGQIDWREEVTEGIAAYDGFRAAALTTRTDDFPELYQLDDRGLFALRVDEIREPALQPLDEVRDAVAEAWRTAQIADQLEAQAQEAAQAIRDGAEMAGLNLPLATDREILRDAFLEGAPEGFVEGVFQMEAGDIRVFRDEGAAVLVRLDAVNLPDHEDEEAVALKAQFSAQTRAQMANDALQLFTQRLQTTADIQINQQAVDALFTQFHN